MVLGFSMNIAAKYVKSKRNGHRLMAKFISGELDAEGNTKSPEFPLLATTFYFTSFSPWAAHFFIAGLFLVNVVYTVHCT